MYKPREHYITQLLPKSTTVAIMQGKSLANSGKKSTLCHRWCERGAEFGQRMQGVWEKTCPASSADHCATSKVETWKERLQNSDYAGPLTTNITRRLSAKKRTSVPFYLLSKQSGTDFLNASSRMVATRGPEEDRTKSHVIMRQTL